MNKNKAANFWIRLTFRVIDLLIVISIISITAYFSTDHSSGRVRFKSSALYYTWSFTSFIIMMFFTTLLPLITKGRTIGNLITRTKVESKNIYISILRREMFFGIAWGIMILALTLILSRDLMEKIMDKNISIQKNLTSLESFKFALVNTFSGIIIFLQLLFGVSIIIKRSTNSFLDKLSSSHVVWENKFIKVTSEPQLPTIKPILIKNKPVKYIKGE